MGFNHFGEDIYKDIKKIRVQIERYLNTNEVKLSSTNKNKLLSQEFWNEQLNIMTCAETLAKHFGEKQFDDYNKFSLLLNKTVKDLKLKLDPKSIKLIIETISWRNQDAERVIGKTDKDCTVHYLADSELRDTEKVPLDEDIHEYFKREILKYIPDAWIDETKTVKGYEIAFSRYFHKYDAPVLKNISATFKQYKEYNPVSTDYFLKLPKGWDYLPNIAIFNEKLERNKNDAELLSVTITSGVIRQSEVDKNDTSNSDKSKYKFIIPNDIVYNKMRMWQGAVGASIYSGIVSPAYIVVSPKIKIDSKYFHYQFRSSYYINYSKRFSYGLCDDMLSLRYTDFKRMYSILPPIDTQKEIAKALTTIDNYLLNKVSIIQKIMGRKIVLQSTNIENSLYDFIVWQLISGQVDVDSIKIDEIENIVDKLFTES